MLVDGAASQPLMLSVSEIARMKGVSKEAVSKRVKRFEADGLIVTQMRGQQKLVPMAEYDRLIGQTTDFAKVREKSQAPSEPTEQSEPLLRKSTAEDPVRAVEDARKARYAADLAEIELKEALGEILLVADVEKAMTRCAEAIVRKIDQLVTHAEDMAAAVGQGGVPAARAALKALGTELRQTVADSMRLLAAEDDPAGEQEEGA